MTTLDDNVNPSTELVGWGARFEKLRNNQALDEWCEIVGSNRNSWRKYEGEKQSPGMDLLLRLHERLGVSLDELVTGKKPFVLDVELLIRAYAVAKVFSDDFASRGGPEYGPSQMVGLMLDYYQDPKTRSAMDDFVVKKAQGQATLPPTTDQAR